MITNKSNMSSERLPIDAALDKVGKCDLCIMCYYSMDKFYK